MRGQKAHSTAHLPSLSLAQDSDSPQSFELRVPAGSSPIRCVLWLPQDKSDTKV